MRRGRPASGAVLLLACVVAGCGSGTGMLHRSEIVYEELHAGLGLGTFEADIPEEISERIVYRLVELRSPQRQLLRVVVWKDWSDVNRALTGTPARVERARGFCRRVGTARTCVVGDRVTASGRMRFVRGLGGRLRVDLPA